MRVHLQIQSRGEDADVPTTTLVPLADEAEFPGDVGETFCLSVLERLQSTLEQLKHASADGELYLFGFQLQSLDNGGNVVAEWSETQFCEHAAGFLALHPALHAYAVATAEGAYDSRIWADSETPAGTAAILALVMRDHRWIPAYVDFLRTCDLDHEVDQWGDMDGIIAKYGWQEDTCALAAARVVSCHGQHGEEQLSSWLETGLRDYLDTAGGRTTFLAAARAEFDADSPQMREKLTMSRESFCDDADFWLDFFAPALDEPELEALRLHAHGRWDRARGLPA